MTCVRVQSDSAWPNRASTSLRLIVSTRSTIQPLMYSSEVVFQAHRRDCLQVVGVVHIGGRDSQLSARGQESLIAGRNHEVVLLDLLRSSTVHCVVAPQGCELRQLCRPLDQSVISL